MELTAPRGSRDFLPQEATLREHVTATLKSAFLRYGFQPLETPVMEHLEVLSSKFAGGEEILKETYRLTDQGGRVLGLRYDLTVPLCRVFAGNMLAKPFKRYQIAPVFRDGPLKKGRYREFYQCDVDTLGVESVAAEAELLALACESFQSLGLEVILNVNHRALLNGLLEHAGVPAEKHHAVLLSLDKLEKIGKKGVFVELMDVRGLPKTQAEKTLKVFEDAQGSPFEYCGKVKNESAQKGFSEIKYLFELLEAYGAKAQLSPTLARGLNYYTGTVYEVFLKEGAITSSLAAGGRYDEMVGKFSGKEKIPAVGISFGLDVICECLKDAGKVPASSAGTVFILPIGDTVVESIRLAQRLRQSGISCALDLQGKGISKGLTFASKQGFPFALLVGENEVREGKFTLRDLISGTEKNIRFDALIDALVK